MKYVKSILFVMAAISGVVPFVVRGQAQKPTPVIQIGLASPFPQAKETFDEAMQILKKDSYNADLNDEVIYYSAIKGILRHLSPQNNKDLLKLWGPETDKLVQANLAGKIGSIGIRFLHDPEAGVAYVADVMPGTPAQQKGLMLRDEILAIDGAPLKGVSPADVAAMIEKPAGTKVKLAMRRAGKLFDISMACEVIKVDDVRSEIVSGYGVIRVRFFSQNTAADIQNELKELKAKNVRGIVFDLRNNSGGLLDVGIKSADQMLAQSSTILFTVGRNGEPRRYLAETGGDTTTPVAVIINGESASAAELFAAALKDNKRAKVIGVPSMGKGTTENIAKLKNGYSMTYMAAAMYGPAGESWQDRGVIPDSVVDIPRGDLEMSYMEGNTAKKLALDKQLDLALNVLTTEPRR